MRIRLLLLLALTLAACDQTPRAIKVEKPDPEVQPGQEEDPGQGTQEGTGQETPTEEEVPPRPEPPVLEDLDPPADYTAVSLKSAVTNVQPMTGIVVWQDNSAHRKSWVTLEYSYVRYCDVCKKKGVYDWSPVEKLLSDAASRGHQTVLRFYYTYVGKQCAVPDYIKAWPGYEETSGKSERKTTYFPDWRCEELQRFHLEFYRLFAQKYDQDPRLAFLETGFGLWAEYHIYDGPFVLGKTFPSKAVQADFLTKMDGWFRNTPWLISIDAAESKYGPFQGKPALKNLYFGNFDDSFMAQDHDSDNASKWRFFGKERYKKAPLGGEFSYYKDDDQEHALDKEGMYGRVFEDEVAKYHMTFIIGNDQPGNQSDDRIREAAMSMGYRFRIADFRIKPGTGAYVRITNTGVAPIYRDTFLALDGTRGADLNLRYLQPGQTATVLIPLASATETSVLTIESDALLPGTTIPFDADL